MDPISTEVVKATAGPITEGGQKLLATVFGGAAGEFGAYFKDQVTLWRAGRGIYTAERATEMLRAAGLEPRPVKMKPLLNIMEGATIEDDDDLSEMWAALLANASVGDLGGAESSFSAILRQLSATDAVVLRAAFVHRNLVKTAQRERTVPPRTFSLSVREVRSREGIELRFTAAEWLAETEVPELRSLAAIPPAALLVSADNLIRLGLLVDRSKERVKLLDESGWPVRDRRYTLGSQISSSTDRRSEPRKVEVAAQNRTDVALSSLGAAFADACEPPSGR